MKKITILLTLFSELAFAETYLAPLNDKHYKGYITTTTKEPVDPYEGWECHFRHPTSDLSDQFFRALTSDIYNRTYQYSCWDDPQGSYSCNGQLAIYEDDTVNVIERTDRGNNYKVDIRQVHREQNGYSYFGVCQQPINIE